MNLGVGCGGDGGGVRRKARSQNNYLDKERDESRKRIGHRKKRGKWVLQGTAHASSLREKRKKNRRNLVRQAGAGRPGAQLANEETEKPHALEEYGSVLPCWKREENAIDAVHTHDGITTKMKMP